MNANMPNQPEQKKENFLVLFQSARRSVPRKSAEIRLDKRMRSAFAEIVGEDGTVPSKGLYAARAGDQHPSRIIGRRLVEAKEANTPLDRALAPIKELERWVREDLYGQKVSA
jgi:hypothetical protein